MYDVIISCVTTVFLAGIVEKMLYRYKNRFRRLIIRPLINNRVKSKEFLLIGSGSELNLGKYEKKIYSTITMMSSDQTDC